MNCLGKLLFLFIPLCLSCNSDSLDESVSIAIDFNAKVQNNRAVADYSDVQTDGFSVWGGFSGSNVFDGTIVSYQSGGWRYSEPKMWTKNTYGFHAVYPDVNEGAYTSVLTNTDYSQFTINGFDTTSQQDLLYANSLGIDGNNPPASVNLTFGHILTKVSIKLLKHDDNANDEVIATSVYLYGMYTQGDYINTSGTGEWSGLSNSTQMGINNLSETLTTSTPAELFKDYLMIPQTFSNDHTVYLVVNYTFKQYGSTGDANTKVLIAPLPYSTIWETNSDIVYTATIHVDHNIEFATPVVEEWGTEQAGGTIIIT